MSTVAFCLLTYRHDHPSGIERSIAALMAGLRSLGHTALVIAAGPASDTDDREPGMVRLSSTHLPRPAINADVLAALADPGPVAAEVTRILADRDVDLVVWADTLWGLGYLSPAPPNVTTALMVHKIRPSDEERWITALAAADHVLPASDYLHHAGAAAGLDVTRWTTVTNSLLCSVTPTTRDQREHLRRNAPIRLVSRVEPDKGLVEFLDALPAAWARPVELVLAEADFEFWPGMQRDLMAACRDRVAARSDVLTLLPPLSWHDVPGFFRGGAATVIPSIEPETFCHTAAEALSVATPVAGFDLGNVPLMVGPAGVTIPLEDGAPALWRALHELLDDPDRYHDASAAAPSRVSGFSATDAARTLLDAAHLHTRPTPVD